MTGLNIEATKSSKTGSQNKSTKLLRSPITEKEIVPFGLSPRKEMVEENPLLHMCNKSNKTGTCSHAV